MSASQGTGTCTYYRCSCDSFGSGTEGIQQLAAPPPPVSLITVVDPERWKPAAGCDACFVV